MRRSNTSACQVCLLQTLEMATKEHRKQTRNDERLDIGHAQQLRWEQMVFQMGADCLSDRSRLLFRWEQIPFNKLPFAQEADYLSDNSRLPFRRP